MLFWSMAALPRRKFMNLQKILKGSQKPHAWIDAAEGFAGLLKTHGLTWCFCG